LTRKMAIVSDEGAQLSAGDEATVGASSLAAFRKTVIAFLATLNKGWVPQRWLDRLSTQIRRAGHPAEVTAEEIVAFIEVSAFLFLLLGVVLVLWLDASPL